MIKLFHDLLIKTGINFHSNLRNPKISGITFDSRNVQKGDLFIGIPGETFDGGNYWSQAISKGAVASIIGRSTSNLISLKSSDVVLEIDNIEEYAGLLAANFWDNPSSKIPLIGVTGTNGKTTTTYLIDYICKALGTPSALFGTLGNSWPGNNQKVCHTTNFADKLQAQLACAVKEGARLSVMEVSSHALAQKRVSGCEFSGAIFTNLTQDHLDYHSSMDEYFETKSLLFKKPFFDIETNKAIINIDDSWGLKLSERLKGKCWRSSLVNGTIDSSEAELQIKVLELSQTGTKGYLKTPLSEGYFISPLVGRFNLMNLLQAIGVLTQQGYSLDPILKVIKDFPGVPGRMERVLPSDKNISKIPMVLVDYAHTPDGLKNALVAAKSFSKGQIICVFGCGGDRDRGKRSKMGSIAAKYSDRVIITSDNPRSEDPVQITQDILLGISSTRNVLLEPNRSLAINFAIAQSEPEDLILIAGKGHEDYQIIGSQKMYFNDREEVRKIFNRM